MLQVPQIFSRAPIPTSGIGSPYFPVAFLPHARASPLRLAARPDVDRRRRLAMALPPRTIASPAGCITAGHQPARAAEIHCPAAVEGPPPPRGHWPAASSYSQPHGARKDTSSSRPCARKETPDSSSYVMDAGLLHSGRSPSLYLVFFVFFSEIGYKW